MRFLLTGVVWLVIVGGLWLYMQNRTTATVTTQEAPEERLAVTAQMSLLLTPTFSLEPDPFALQGEEGSDSGLLLRLNGGVVPLEAGNLRRGESLALTVMPELRQGTNELYVQGSPPLAEADMEHGIRVRVLRDGLVVRDETIWAAPGSLVAGTVGFSLDAGGEDHHD